MFRSCFFGITCPVLTKLVWLVEPFSPPFLTCTDPIDQLAGLGLSNLSQLAVVASGSLVKTTSKVELIASSRKIYGNV